MVTWSVHWCSSECSTLPLVSVGRWCLACWPKPTWTAVTSEYLLFTFPACPPDDTSQGHWHRFHGTVPKPERSLCVPVTCWASRTHSHASCQPLPKSTSVRTHQPCGGDPGGCLVSEQTDRQTDLEEDELPWGHGTHNRFVCSKFGDIFASSFSRGSFSFNSQNGANEGKWAPAGLKHGTETKWTPWSALKQIYKRNSLFGLGF